MRRFSTLLAAVAMASLTTPAFSHHLENLNTPYPSRGVCESTVAHFNQDDWDDLLAAWPTFFSTQGDIASFLVRAFPCELNESDGQWYIRSHFVDVLQSDWYTRHQ